MTLVIHVGKLYHKKRNDRWRMKRRAAAIVILGELDVLVKE